MIVFMHVYGKSLWNQDKKVPFCLGIKSRFFTDRFLIFSSIYGRSLYNVKEILSFTFDFEGIIFLAAIFLFLYILKGDNNYLFCQVTAFGYLFFPEEVKNDLIFRMRLDYSNFGVVAYEKFEVILFLIRFGSGQFFWAESGRDWTRPVFFNLIIYFIYFMPTIFFFFLLSLY